MKTFIALVTLVTSMAFANQPVAAPAAQTAPAVQGQTDKMAAAPAVEQHKAGKKAKKVKKH